MTIMSNLTALSPLDGRYAKDVAELRGNFSEMALMRYRLMVEVEYFIALSLEKGIAEIPAFNSALQKKLRGLYKNFSLSDAEQIKTIEQTTNHDVKAIEYFIKEKIKALPCAKYSEFIHFALTSEDINNIAYSLMWQDGLNKILLPELILVHKTIATFARQHIKQPLLALTHGQPATPTTVGKEFAVFAKRLERKISRMNKHHRLLGKLNGATGGYNAMVIAYPNVDWIKFSKKFVTSLDLEFNPLTTQIEPHDSLAEQCRLIQHINNILIDFSRDIWLYIMRGVLGQKKKEGEIGSSTMPHKINPINFENAEGNLGMANALLNHFAEKLPISRLQRDLSDSTVLRNQGVALGYSLLALKNILKGMSRLTVNSELLNSELENHWEVLAEAIQTILRKVGYAGAYEKLKELTRGQKMTKETIRAFVKKLDIPKNEKEKLLKLTPQNYTGLAGSVSVIARKKSRDD